MDLDYDAGKSICVVTIQKGLQAIAFDTGSICGTFASPSPAYCILHPSLKV